MTGISAEAAAEALPAAPPTAAPTPATPPRRATSLRLRLLLALAAVVGVTILVAGALLVGATRANQIERIDDGLRAAVRDGLRGLAGPRDPDEIGGRRYAVIVIGPQGRIVASAPSGFRGQPDPLPDVTDLATAIEAGNPIEIGVPRDRRAVDGPLMYRALIAEVRMDAMVVVAAPLDELDAATRALVRSLVILGIGAVAAVVLLGWLILRSGLRPLESMSAAADGIAAGDLTVRVGLPHDGTEVGRLGAAFDRMLDRIEATVSEEREARAAKEASEARLRRFVSDASHELRTPLTTVRGYADLYGAGGLPAGPGLDAAMARIAGEGERMTRLVEDLLLLARLDQGRPLRREPVDLGAIVGEAAADARAVEPDRPIEAAIADVPTILGDADRLRQVVSNLLDNVRLHSPAGSPVEVDVTSIGGDAIELRVVDHGPGIEPDAAERIFDRFYRADGGRSRDRGGSGLGLSIVRSIVTAHGGSVTHVPTPGGGATFVVRLPIGHEGDPA